MSLILPVVDGLFGHADEAIEPDDKFDVWDIVLYTTITLRAKI